jgi:hypothetical protein
MKYIIGAYATAPSLGLDDIDLEREFYDQLINSIPNIQGFEIPFWGEEIHKFGTEFLLGFIRPEWDHVLTCIPGSVKGVEKNPRFGLASNDIKGRSHAVSMHKRANQMVQKINMHSGRSSVLAVHIATAPSVPVDGVTSSVDSLLLSMNEILSWDWMGARIVIEHCDSHVEGRPFEKGFMSINDELLALKTLADNLNVGFTINWARSAIEGRSPSVVIDHINLARANNLLTGFVFSGVSDKDGNYGLWKDSHMPFEKSFGIEHYQSGSLLTTNNIENTLKALDLENLDYLGVKLLAMPIDSVPINIRVGVNRDAITVLNRTLFDISSEISEAI